MSEIAKAVEILQRGGLVAFATETVYGLGADATNAAAVERIFAAKGRPPTNPLIAHVADEATARRFATLWPEAAARLARQFWPGPLTLIVPKSPSIVDQATAGRSTVALRSPDHPLALQLLREFGGAVAAPSANRSTRVSPTTAQHVCEELGDSVDLILDGGPCRVGIESTVLDLSTATPTILRPGSITQQQLESHIGPVRFADGSVDPSVAALGPGMHAVHYAPKTQAFWFPFGGRTQVQSFVGRNAVQRTAILHLSDGLNARLAGIWSAAMTQSPMDYAREIYKTLRAADQSGAEMILIEMPPDEPQWTAVRDRLMRAARPLPQE